MYCIKCGSNIPDEAGMCPYCGTALKASAPRRMSPEKLLTKPLLFITGSLMIIQFIISIYQLIGNSAYYGMSLPDMILRVLLFFVFLFPMIFEIVGMFKLGAYRAKPGSSPGCGFFKTSYILRIIYNAIFTVIMIITFIVSSFAAYEASRYGFESGEAIIIAGMILLAVQVLKICYYASMIGVANTTKEKLTGFVSNRNYSLFPVVLNIFVILFRMVVSFVIIGAYYVFYKFMPFHISGSAMLVIVLIQLVVSCLRVVMAFISRGKVSRENEKSFSEKADNSFGGYPVSHSVPHAEPLNTYEQPKTMYNPVPISPYTSHGKRETAETAGAYPDNDRTDLPAWAPQPENGNSMFKKPESMD